MMEGPWCRVRREARARERHRRWSWWIALKVLDPRRPIREADITRRSKLAPVSAAFCSLWLSVGVCGQAHGEHRAFARLARHGHVATHHAREPAGEGETESGAAEVLSGRGIGLAELLEQLCLLLRGHADAGFGDGELDEIAAIAHLACHKLHLARFGELAGIAQKVEQDLPQPHWIDGQCAEVLLGVNDEAVLVLLGKLSGGADNLVDQWC